MTQTFADRQLKALEIEARLAAKRLRGYHESRKKVVDTVVAMRAEGIDEEAIRAHLTVAGLNALDVLDEVYRRAAQ